MKALEGTSFTYNPEYLNVAICHCAGTGAHIHGLSQNGYINSQAINPGDKIFIEHVVLIPNSPARFLCRLINNFNQELAEPDNAPLNASNPPKYPL